ncbi:MAG: hypothetical protein U0T78_09205 [Cloacibacterium normanense]
MNELKKCGLDFSSNRKVSFFGSKVGLTKGSVSGDTRFDRVKQIKNRDNSVERVYF